MNNKEPSLTRRRWARGRRGRGEVRRCQGVKGYCTADPEQGSECWAHCNALSQWLHGGPRRVCVLAGTSWGQDFPSESLGWRVKLPAKPWTPGLLCRGQCPAGSFQLWGSSVCPQPPGWGLSSWSPLPTCATSSSICDPLPAMVLEEQGWTELGGSLAAASGTCPRGARVRLAQPGVVRGEPCACLGQSLHPHLLNRHNSVIIITIGPSQIRVDSRLPPPSPFCLAPAWTFGHQVPATLEIKWPPLPSPSTSPLGLCGPATPEVPCGSDSCFPRSGLPSLVPSHP